MSHPLILGHLTVMDCSPPHVVEIAADSGFPQVGLRIIPSRPDSKHYPLHNDPQLLAETERRLRDTGVTIYDFDVIRLTAETSMEDLRPAIEAGARLGAKSVLVTAGDPDRARFTDSYGALCDLAAGFGITADLEYMLFTPTVPDHASAIEVVRNVGRANAGVLVDAIHFDRLGANVDELRATPRELMHYIHLTDARAERPTTIEGLIEDTRAYRMLPGEGGIDLVAFLQALPDDLPLCVEVSNAELDRTLSPRERAVRAMQATKSLLAAAGR